ncbi:MAG: DUF4199 domain-containing protein [Bacteroidetes bacterium]|nr:MAG: DUF4199 domain-containing protein [Bacteroidota bacterium]
MDPKVKYGLIAGTGTVALFLLFYFSEPAWMLHPALWWGSLLIYIWAMVKVAREPAKIGVRQGLREAFGVFALANLIFYVFYYFQFTTFAPELVEMQREMMLQSDFITKEQKSALDIDMTLRGTIFRYCWSLIGGFVLSLGLSAFLNRV